MTNDLVSVVIPTYNRGHIVIATVRSALGQTYKDLEVIVVDDGSTDDTESRIAGIKDNRIRYQKIDHFGYPAPARNQGIKLARGKYIAFIDSDDLWLPTKLEEQVRLLEQNPHIVAVASDFVYVNGDNRPVLKLKRDRIVSFKDIFRQNIIVNSSIIFRRELINAVGLLDEDAALKSVEDIEYWLRILTWRDASIIVLKKALVKYRIHSSNISQQQQDLAPMIELKRLLGVFKKYFADPRVNVSQIIKKKLDYAYFFFQSRQIVRNPREFLHLFRNDKMTPLYKVKLLRSLLQGIMRALSKL